MKVKKLKIFLVLGIIVLFAVSAFAGIFYFIKSKDKANHVPIAMALDDGYIYPTVVAMTSMLENMNKDTKYDFYIMHPSEFSKENKDKLKGFEDKYEKCSINLIDMEDRYKNAFQSGYITTPTYYRLSLSDLLPDLDKIIWLDGDTLVFSDLKEMYNIDMEGYYYKGILDNSTTSIEGFEINNDHPICAGVMLINLKELRENDMVNKFSKFIEENHEKLIQHDQTTINVLCYEKIGILPPRFGVFNIFFEKEEAEKYLNSLVSEDKYSEEDLKDAFESVCVLHCVNKPWKDTKYPFANTWWDYAKKTGYYEEICSEYSISKGV